jgi:DNA-binding IclR family transcriptional regulator
VGAEPEEITLTVLVPEIPSTKPIVLSRAAATALSTANITSVTAYRVLIRLIAQHHPKTGVAQITQAELAAAVGTTKQAVNRACQSLSQAGLITYGDDGGCYSLHPALVAGAAPRGTLREAPVIESLAPEDVSELLRDRYRAQTRALSLCRP